MALIIAFVVAWQSALGVPRGPRPGDIVRLDTGIPNTGIPAVRLWYPPRGRGREPAFALIDLWAFRASCEQGDLLDQVHLMADRGALVYLPNRKKVRVVAIHDDKEWTASSGPLKGMAIVEIKLVERGHAVESDDAEDRRIRAADPEPKSRPYTYAVPSAYFAMAGPRRHPALAKLPVLEMSSDNHGHRYCVLEEPAVHRWSHVDAIRFADAERRREERGKAKP